jgi:non-specific serine/threonine protein kinase
MLTPDWGSAAMAARLPQFESVRLFVERTRLVRPDFVVTEQNAADVVTICRALDGLPLALELAGARGGVLEVEEIAERLGGALDELGVPGRTVEVRQRTLRGAIDWSYALLDAAERRVFARLSVFAGGCFADAAGDVCAGPDVDAGSVPGIVASLVRKSLVVAETRDGEERYRLLDTLRAYASEQLVASGEAEQTRARLADNFLRVAERGEFELRRPEQARWWRRLTLELDNLRLAMDWYRERDPERALRIVAALWWFWSQHLSEGLSRLRQALEAGTNLPSRLRARGWAALAFVAANEGDHSEVRRSYDAVRSLCEPPDGADLVAHVTLSLGMVVDDEGDEDEGRQLAERAERLAREAGDRWLRSRALVALVETAIRRDEARSAEALISEAAALAREIGDPRTEADIVKFRGVAARNQGRLEEAEAAFAQSAAAYRQSGDRLSAAMLRREQANLARLRGDPSRARELLAQSIDLDWSVGRRAGIVRSLRHLVLVEHLDGDIEAAARYAGLCARAEGEVTVVFDPAVLRDSEQAIQEARRAMGDDLFARAFEEGRAMTLSEGVRAILARR